MAGIEEVRSYVLEHSFRVIVLASSEHISRAPHSSFRCALYFP
jgi:hypothetical protein